MSNELRKRATKKLRGIDPKGPGSPAFADYHKDKDGAIHRNTPKVKMSKKERRKLHDN